MEKKVQLTDDQINYLSELPEQGMGYQIVDIFLTNGKILKKRVVVNSTYLKLENNENITTADITKIELSQ